MTGMRASIVVMIAAGLAGCSQGESQSHDSSAGSAQAVAERDTSTAPLRTSQSAYVLTRDGVLLSAPVPVRFTNHSPDTLYLVNCNGALTPVYEKQVGGEWKPYLETITNSCLSSPVVIAPRATLVDTLMLAGAMPGGNAGPSFASADVDGVYRIVMRNVRWHYDPSKPQFGDTVPLRYLHSNTFRVTVGSTNGVP